MLKKITREFAEEYLVPVAQESDEKQELDETALQKLKEMNYFGACIPEEYGGVGLHNDTIGYCIVVEEIGRADAAWGLSIAVHNSLATYPIYKYGTEEQKQKFLIDLAKGDKIGAFCLTEADAGSDAGGVQLTAERDGNEYILNGSKIFATNGGIANTLLVITKTSEKEGRKQLTVFIVDATTPGYSVGAKEDKLGVRGSNTSELVFEDVRVPQENILGGIGDGFKLTMQILGFGRIAIAAQSVGLGQAALEASIKYANERVQFGQPIGRFQAIQWKIADMGVEVECARLLTYKASWLCDNGLDYGLVGSMAKLKATEAAMQATHDAVQIHGAYGYMSELGIEKQLRDSIAATIYSGTSEIQLNIIARCLGL